MASALDVVTVNLAAYNARDLDSFAASFDPEIEIYDYDLPDAGVWT